jgi:hypothetical protein
MAVTGAQFYDQAIADYQKKALADKNTQLTQIANTESGGLRDAYIARMQNQKNLNRNLAQAGIRGGATETSNLNLLNAYQKQRNAVTAQASQDRLSANQTYNDNVFNYTQQMRTAQAEYLQNKENTDRNLRNEYYQALYNKSYSVKKLKKALKKASNREQKMAINQRIAYLTEHKKGY